MIIMGVRVIFGMLFSVIMNGLSIWVMVLEYYMSSFVNELNRFFVINLIMVVLIVVRIFVRS